MMVQPELGTPIFHPIFWHKMKANKRTKEITSITGANLCHEESKQKLVAICSANYANQELVAVNEISTE